jgi:hypothetical protein
MPHAARCEFVAGHDTVEARFAGADARVGGGGGGRVLTEGEMHGGRGMRHDEGGALVEGGCLCRDGRDRPHLVGCGSATVPNECPNRAPWELVLLAVNLRIPDFGFLKLTAQGDRNGRILTFKMLWGGRRREKLGALRTAEGVPLPENTQSEFRRDMARLRLVREQIKAIEQERLRKLEAAAAAERDLTRWFA